MKNPFKGLGEKIKAVGQKFKITEEKKAEVGKSILDSFGDGCFVGGLTLIGAAVLAPVATVPTVIAGTVFIAAGGVAKYTASKMNPNGPTLEKAVPPVPPAAEETPALPKASSASKDFGKALGKDGAAPATAPATVPAPKPETPKP